MMQIAPFKALIADFSKIPDPEAFCAATRDRFVQDRAAGVYCNIDFSAMYVLQIEDTMHRYTGLVATTPLTDLLDGRIRQHEQTMPAKEAHQLALFREWNAMPKPALLTYQPVAAITAWLEQMTRHKAPQTTVHFDNEVHRLWPITKLNDQQDIVNLFQQEVSHAYIADGHHRITAVRHWHEQQPEEAQQALFCAYFAADMVKIGDFNRVLILPEDLSVADFLYQLSAFLNDERINNDECRMMNDEFGIRNSALEIRNEKYKPAKKHELTCFDGKHWHRLRWREEMLAQSTHILDVQYFNELIVKNTLQSTDVRTDTRIRYVEGSKGHSGIEQEVSQHPNAIGFMLYPIAFSDMAALSDRGIMLPPKSTFFEPRIRSGLIVRPL